MFHAFAGRSGRPTTEWSKKLGLKPFLVPVFCASLLAPSLPVVQAAAAPLPRAGVGSDDGSVVLVDRRGYGRHRGHGRGHGGSGAVGVIGAIIAGTLIAAAIREGRAHEEDLERCDEDFPDFDYETGTYINRYGEERICPYLR